MMMKSVMAANAVLVGILAIAPSSLLAAEPTLVLSLPGRVTLESPVGIFDPGNPANDCLTFSTPIPPARARSDLLMLTTNAFERTTATPVLDGDGTPLDDCLGFSEPGNDIGVAGQVRTGVMIEHDYELGDFEVVVGSWEVSECEITGPTTPATEATGGLDLSTCASTPTTTDFSSYVAALNTPPFVSDIEGITGSVAVESVLRAMVFDIVIGVGTPADLDAWFVVLDAGTPATWPTAVAWWALATA